MPGTIEPGNGTLSLSRDFRDLTTFTEAAT
jgi:hypothetical protein